MTAPLSDWTPRPRPDRAPQIGRYTRLEPLEVARHADDLFKAATAGDAAARFRYLPERPHTDRDDFTRWLSGAADRSDPLFFAVVDAESGQALGRQALMRITPQDGTAEIGNIHWGPGMARSRIATEALYLAARQIFDLGYRRFEWKCNALNQPSRDAALRFGFRFEGIFRNHMIVKGHSRDTAWFAMTDSDWEILCPRFQVWLDPQNFDADGQQIRRLDAAG